MKGISFNTPRPTKARTEWEEIQDDIIEWLKLPRGQVQVMLKGWKPNEIRDIRKKATTEGKNPKGLFIYLLKQKK